MRKAKKIRTPFIVEMRTRGQWYPLYRFATREEAEQKAQSCEQSLRSVFWRVRNEDEVNDGSR